MDLNGKTALVTGGAHRLGKAISMALAQAGCHVAVNYHRSAAAAEATVAEARTYGVQAEAWRADVADPGQVEQMVTAIKERFGRLDVLVNSASPFQRTPFPTRDLAAWQRVTGVLIHGAFYCANAAAPLMLGQGAGCIINIADLSAWQPWPNFAAHSVGKAALLALTRQLALELAPTVRVNAVAPGLILPPPDYSPAQVQRAAGKTLLRRWGSPADVTDAVMYLIQAEYVTGEVIAVDGGERFGHLRPFSGQ